MDLKEMHKQKSTWAGLAAIVAAAGGYFSGGVDLATSIQGVFMGLVLIFMPEFKK